MSDTDTLRTRLEVQWDPDNLWPAGALTDEPKLADFGPGLASVDVDEAVLATLRKWLPTYLRYVAASRSLGYELAVPAAASYANVISDAEFTDKGLPSILVATAQTDGELEIVDGAYVTPWLVAISAVVRGRTAPETRMLASYYELAIRMALVQQGTLDGFASATRWMSGGESRPLADPTGAGRWLGEGASQFRVFTDVAVREGIGPSVPDQEPYEEPPDVGEVDVDVGGTETFPTPDRKTVFGLVDYEADVKGVASETEGVD